MIPPVDVQLQRNPDLSPFKWLHTVNVGDANRLLSDDNMDKIFRSHRNKYIYAILQKVIEEQKEDNGVISDNLDTETNRIRHVRFENDTIKYETERKDPYDSIPANYVGKTEVKILDLIDCNPYSYKSVGTVLKSIHKESEREWAVIACDGLPFILGSRLMKIHALVLLAMKNATVKTISTNTWPVIMPV